MTMEESDVRLAFLSEYTQYVTNVLAPTQREVKSFFRGWKETGYFDSTEEMRGNEDARHTLTSPSPIQSVNVRVKRPESASDKITRHPKMFPDGLSSASFRKMNDTVGARVIVYFLSHIPLIDREIRQRSDFLEISQDYPPVAYLDTDTASRLSLTDIQCKKKESGYASVHYILRLKESAVPVGERPWFELQLRTLAEHTWGEIEHLLGYKPGKRTTFAAQKQFQIISKLLSAIDDHFNLLYEELVRHQIQEVDAKDSDDLTAENLPPELARQGVGCAQRQIDGLLKLLASRQVVTVGRLRELATPKRLEIIRNTYSNMKGRPPNNFEVVSSLANLGESQEDNEQVRLVRAHISYLEVWDDLRRREKL